MKQLVAQQAASQTYGKRKKQELPYLDEPSYDEGGGGNQYSSTRRNQGRAPLAGIFDSLGDIEDTIDRETEKR